MLVHPYAAAASFLRVALAVHLATGHGLLRPGRGMLLAGHSLLPLCHGVVLRPGRGKLLADHSLLPAGHSPFPAGHGQLAATGRRYHHLVGQAWLLRNHCCKEN